ncbi:hypothetical protein KY290_024164 [Solanum tuberosum]|uniref:NAC domain-containing protein n=1 Tax=Solanum tuberosum TaxID=4113 RepID=A0ABQ7URP0_SOLTU|nr:hypothetical protein KY289_025604 [Solanum tuberosum]KAH0753894.1 hypothetical protein KY290_024164 [Solanum tuberosum]
MVGKISSDLPPGFRFHPTDEELIMYYLRYQATSRPCPVSIIPEIDVYKFDPWELPEKAEFGENEWYFFTPRDRKYPNGVRPNRAAVSGYWKATGTDKAIYSANKYVGIKKALVFYKGKPPKGVKTDWIMHEYRLSDSKSQTYSKQSGSMRLDDWVLCRIYKKKNLGKTIEMMKVEEEELEAQNVAPLDVFKATPLTLGLQFTPLALAENWGVRSFLREHFFEPGLSPEDAVARIRQTADGLHSIKEMLETNSWRYVLFYIRLKSAYLKQDMKNALSRVPESRKESYIKTANELTDNMAEFDYYIRTPKVYESRVFYEKTLKSIDELVGLLA